jgi:hypothetical protein
VSPHRTPGEVLPDGPAPLHVGPAKVCKGCGNKRILAIEGGYARLDNGKETSAILGYHDKSPLAHPRACTPGARVKVGWFRRCSDPREHLHERCKVCGLEWLTAFAEGS